MFNFNPTYFSISTKNNDFTNVEISLNQTLLDKIDQLEARIAELENK